MIIRVTRCVFIGLVLLAGFAQAARRALADQDPLILRAVFAEQRLWLVGSDGELSSIAENGERLDAAMPDRVLDLFVQEGRVVIVTSQRKTCAQWMANPNALWTVRRRVGTGWETVAEIACRGETLVTAGATGETITLLTEQRIINLTGGSQSETTLSRSSSDELSRMFDPSRPLDQQQATINFPFPLTYLYRLGSGPSRRAGLVGAMLVTPAHIFVGYNAGEFGGGLKRIDRATGAIFDIGDDEPIHGIVSIPWKPDCVAIAVGLVHMVASGRIMEVCDHSVRVLYERKVSEETVSNADGRTGWIPEHTTAFFGLMRTGEDLLAAGHDGLYRISSGDVVRQIPLPHFKDIGGIAVSFDIPDLALVLTSANQRFSLSGLTPLLVAR
ncbi:hypothetical protein [Bradyrhizobium sp. STM 3809]|uniref:hypothetical protein n=1 Tax=Bradyrhizobium sp. STM 3809 TaxID=551936 RepID=UPI0002408280|nr:hypothetical protein [Bradyrhizobium sp. STM 3809]CCE03535.1 exported hypothetical protein [Bradyrhizobium sp. STM 3809]